MADENIEQKSAQEEQLKDKVLFEKFAKALQQQTIYDPSEKNAVKTNRSYSVYSRENILSWLQSPTSSEKSLRNASIFLYQTSTRYKRLIESLAGLPLWRYVISPVGFNKQKVKKDAFIKSYQKVSNALELMNLADECRKMLVVALRNGVFFGCRWNDSQSAFIQQLDPDYCLITHVSDGTFLFSYDCSSLSEDTLSHFPPEFKQMYDAYVNGGNKYQMVPPDISVCLKADATTVDYSIPVFAGALPDLYDIENAKSLAEVSDILSNYKILHGKIEVDETGVPVVSYETMLQYYNMLANNIGDRVGLALSPFDMKDFSFEKSSASTDVDNVARSVDSYWSTVGTPSVLHGASNNTAGVVKLAIKNDESLVMALVKQCERIINRYLKSSFSGTTKFKITFLPLTVYNYEDYIDKYKNAINYGLAKTYYASAIGLPQYDLAGLNYIEDEVLDIDSMLTPLRTSSTMSGDSLDESEGVGNVEKDETDLSESGEATRDNDSNANR